MQGVNKTAFFCGQVNKSACMGTERFITVPHMFLKPNKPKLNKQEAQLSIEQEP